MKIKKRDERRKRWIKQIHVGKEEDESVAGVGGGGEMEGQELLGTPRASDKFSIGQILKERSPSPPLHASEQV